MKETRPKTTQITYLFHCMWSVFTAVCAEKKSQYFNRTWVKSDVFGITSGFVVVVKKTEKHHNNESLSDRVRQLKTPLFLLKYDLPEEKKKKRFYFWLCSSSVVRRSTGRCAAADSWYRTGWGSRGSGASQRSGHFQSVWPRRARLWCPLAGPGGQPLCILQLSGTGNRQRYSAVRRQNAPSNEHQSCERRGGSNSGSAYGNEKALYLSLSGNTFILWTSKGAQGRQASISLYTIYTTTSLC